MDDEVTRRLEQVVREVQDACPHTAVQPSFDYEAAQGLEASEVQRRWPRFMGQCPTCFQQVILYASVEHYVSGDW